MKRLIVSAIAALAMIVSAPASAQWEDGGGYNSLYDYCARLGWHAVYPGSPAGYWCHTPSNGAWVYVSP